MYQNCGYTWSPNATTKSSGKKTWLWVLGWICIFPLPLTILLLRKKDMKPVVKYGIIAVAWVLFLVIGMAGNCHILYIWNLNRINITPFNYSSNNYCNCKFYRHRGGSVNGKQNFDGWGHARGGNLYSGWEDSTVTSAEQGHALPTPP